MKMNLRKVKGFFFRHKISASVLLIAFLAAGAILAYNYANNPNITFSEIFKPLKEAKETRVPAPLTGKLVDPAVAARRPFAVVIENSPDARPQSGYTKADVVYETLAEGGITRTLAIFQSQDTNEIGPVRSARMYFIDWLSEIDAIFTHCGGAANALREIVAKNIPDINQFYYGNYFWRSSARYAPHNVYTTSEKLRNAAKKAGYSLTGDVKWYSFKEDAQEAERPASQKVTVNFSGPLFVSTFTYDPKTNDYVRSVAGVVAKDAKTGETVRAKNIIIQYESMTNVVRSGVPAVDMVTIGSGKAVFITDGKATVGKWKKDSRSSLTKFTDTNGNEIKLNQGQTWIEVVPLQATVTY